MLYRFGLKKNDPLQKPSKNHKKPIAFILEVLSPVYAWLFENFLHICASEPSKRPSDDDDAWGAREANAKL